MNLILVGHRGSGKSTVGAMLARRLGWRFVDVDQCIAQQAGKSIREIFQSEGEAGFRQREHAVCRSLRRTKEHVIALGGGALESAEIRGVARRLGRIVWLRAPAAVLWSRISRDTRTPLDRPNLTPEGGLGEMETVLARREPAYAALADHVVDTMTESPESIVDAIELWLLADDKI